MAPASQEQELESGSPKTTTRPDNESSVDNIAQAYRDLLRGEQAATALEANLTNLENRLDALLAAFEYPEEPLATADEPATAKNNEPKKDHDAAGHTGESNGLKKAEGPEDPAKKP
ncbi:hypothetical protein Cob_v009360 [Colletotrichum orbiculare MAFF 240422]|uniref:Uncharacterized protein n=1 Tax=Colletotrichum orbiculare (strain 104-T / ATCC 96160 / CBS 514.97 / LARS 414 / MAFF 240422) TaxID=1213857 RepID=A0A484FH89_COLOR|nr:hypothetical protein Cob_v009360 [Colletotrichum orbiculare MAFF 240422]